MVMGKCDKILATVFVLLASGTLLFAFIISTLYLT